MTPFTIAITDPEVAGLKSRLRHTRFPDEVAEAGWEYGTSLPFLRRFVAYWAEEFDWRAAEARLNRFPHFTTEIDGETVHFIHARGKGSNPVPVLLANGWPSNFVELLPMIERLTSDVDGISYDVIIPSLPGYGFSSRPTRKGMNLTQAAHLWARLMDELGYSRFLASGSDLGGGVVLGLVRNYPERLIGAHYCNVYSGYPRPEQPTPEEAEYLKKVEYRTFTEGAYAMVQGTKPTTLAVGLNDSPAGLASWILEKFHSWGETSDIESVFHSRRWQPCCRSTGSPKPSARRCGSTRSPSPIGSSHRRCPRTMCRRAYWCRPRPTCRRRAPGASGTCRT